MSEPMSQIARNELTVHYPKLNRLYLQIFRVYITPNPYCIDTIHENYTLNTSSAAWKSQVYTVSRML